MSELDSIKRLVSAYRSTLQSPGDIPVSDERRRTLVEDLVDAAEPKHLATPESLRDALSRLQNRHTFRAGDVVQWKSGLRDRKHPEYGEPAIVVRLLDQPIVDNESDAGSRYFGESYDVILGVMLGDDTFATLHFNSARFEPFTSADP